MEKFEADTPVHIGNLSAAEEAFQAQLSAVLKGRPNSPVFVTPPSVGTPGHVDHGHKKCPRCGWFDIGCVCGDEDMPPSNYKPNRAQRRAMRHKKK